MVDRTDTEDYQKFPSVSKKYYLVKDRRDKDLRTDPDLIEVIERLGNEANGRHAELKVVEIPDDVEWKIEEYDGQEWIAEEHRTWR